MPKSANPSRCMCVRTANSGKKSRKPAFPFNIAQIPFGLASVFTRIPRDDIAIDAGG
jgi:hypothetical protein